MQKVEPAATAAIGRSKIIAILLVVSPIIFLVISLGIGRFSVPIDKVFLILASYIFPIEQTWSGVEETVVVNVRIPRVLLTMMVGAGLAISGAAFQGLFRNPLVSPSMLGVSAGAGFGAVLGILFSTGAVIIQVLAFIFGLLAVIGAYLLSRMKTGTSLLMLVLAGVIIGALFSALIGLVQYLADPEVQLPSMVFWLMGSMAGASYRDLAWGAPIVLTGMAALLLLRWRINVLSLGEEEAKALGVNVQVIRWVIIIAATAITATAVSMVGIVGWIGLVIPHMGRMLVGPNHKVLLPASISIGAMYLLLIDNVARTATPAEIPLSILTAIIGAPFFAYLLRRTGGKWT